MNEFFSGSLPFKKYLLASRATSWLFCFIFVTAFASMAFLRVNKSDFPEVVHLLRNPIVVYGVVSALAIVVVVMVAFALYVARVMRIQQEVYDAIARTQTTNSPDGTYAWMQPVFELQVRHGEVVHGVLCHLNRLAEFYAFLVKHLEGLRAKQKLPMSGQDLEVLALRLKEFDECPSVRVGREAGHIPA